MKFIAKTARCKKLIQAFGIIAITATSAYADETISFKGIKFGMNAEEIAKLGGGNTENGCQSAINSSSRNKSPQTWTYGGIVGWTAKCPGDSFQNARGGFTQSKQVPGIAGMYQIQTMVFKHGASDSRETYSVEELVDIFSKIFGKFEIETRIMANSFGQEFEKKLAVAYANGARIFIGNVLDGEWHDKALYITITSLDYVAKEDNWEKQKNNQKLNDSKADF
jgi:hypothetical protein